MKNKKGFTVAELMIAIGLMGVLIALAIPATVGNLPNKNLMKFHRTLNSFQTAIQAVLMDASETQEFSDMIRSPMTYLDFKTDNPGGDCFKQCVLAVDANGNKIGGCDNSTLENRALIRSSYTSAADNNKYCFDATGNARYKETNLNAAYTAGMRDPLMYKGTASGTVNITEQMLCNYIAGKMNVKHNDCGNREFTTSDNVRYEFSAWQGAPINLMTVTIRVEPGEDDVVPQGNECTTRIQHATNTFTLQLTPQGKIIMNCTAATRMIIE